MTPHATEEEIGLLLAGRLERAEFCRILRHLLSRCRPCRIRLGKYAEAAFAADPQEVAAPPDESVYDGILDRTIARALDQAPRWQEERRRTEEILAAGHRHPRALTGIQELEDDLPGRPLVEALIELSQEARFRDPEEMLHLAFAARFGAGNLDPERYGPALVADLQMRAWGELGNAWRVNDRLDSAEDAFIQARALFKRGSGDPLVRARVLDLEASLRRAQRRLPEAIELLDTVQELYEQTGERHLAGRALVSKGINIHYDGRPREAVALLRQGMSMLNPGRDRQLVAVAQQDLLHALVDCGELRQARRLLFESGLRGKLAAEPVSLLKLGCVEGKIHAGLGRMEKAEAAFQEARAGFLRRGLEYDAALVGLELAEVWLRQGRTAEVRDMAQEVLETLEDLKVKREALRAVRYLEVACREEVATPALVQRVVGFLGRLEWEPRLQFVP